MILFGFVVVAAIGTLARVLVSAGLNRSDLPLGTLTVNVVGAFLLGLLAGSGVSPDTLTVFGTGALGSFTTFSTVSHEAAMMCRRRQILRSTGYLAATIVVGIAAAWLGLAL